MTASPAPNQITEFIFKIPMDSSTGSDVSDEDMPRAGLKLLKGADTCVTSVEKFLGGIAVHLTVDNHILGFKIYVGGDLYPGKPFNLLNDLEKVSKKIARNAQLPAPKKLSDFVRPLALVPILRALATENERNGFSMSILVDFEYRELPILRRSDFTEPQSNEVRTQIGTFAIHGYYRKDSSRELYFIGKERLFLKIPVEAPQWQGLLIPDLMKERAWVEGLITQASEGEDWIISHDARLVVQTDGLDSSS